MTSGQARLPVAPSMFKFTQHGKCGMWVSELLPHTAKFVDDIALVQAVHTNAINHDPACTFVMTGSEVPGKPSLGSWLAYGLGSESNDLPAFVVLTPFWTSGAAAQALFTRMWASGFLPGKYSGVALRRVGDPVLYVQNPTGVSERQPPGHARHARQTQPADLRQVRRPGDADAHCAVRDGVPHADERAGADRPLEGTGEDARRCTAPK